MQTNVIDIGNSKGIRLSKAVLEQCRIIDKVNLSVQKNQIILTPVEKKEVRKNWGKAFQKMAEGKEDTSLMEDE